MAYLSEFLTIALIHILAAASPGPDFAIVLQQSVSSGRKAAIYTSLGIALGIFVHVAYCILGIGILISKSILLFNFVKILGASYLLYIGFKALRSKPNTDLQDSLAVTKNTSSPFKALLAGFLTNALNPKATLFFLSVFSVVISSSTPASVQFLYGVWMAFATFLWFGSLSLVFSASKVRLLISRFGHWFDRVMGGLLIALGLKLAFSEIKR